MIVGVLYVRKLQFFVFSPKMSIFKALNESYFHLRNSHLHKLGPYQDLAVFMPMTVDRIRLKISIVTQVSIHPSPNPDRPKFSFCKLFPKPIPANSFVESKWISLKISKCLVFSEICIKFWKYF